jgi:hypothetical protein
LKNDLIAERSEAETEAEIERQDEVRSKRSNKNNKNKLETIRQLASCPDN